MSFSSRKLALMGILIALAFALKLPILQLPNIEFFSFVVFCSGFVLGILAGSMVGAVAISLWTFFNPYGFAPWPIALAQIISMILIGFSGGFFRKLNLISNNSIIRIFQLGAGGLVLTFIYDLLTNLATAYVVGQLVPVLVAGIPFALLHIGSNTVIFVMLSPLLLRLARMAEGTR
jgi:uncharacterized membrane protein